LVLASYRPDLLVVCDYGQILSPEVLEVARLGGINLHASLLPKYRGAAPINWAIYHGETQTGVTVIHMTPRLDAGPAIVQVATAIGPEETAAQLEPRLAELGASAVIEAIDALEAATAHPIEQDPALATRAPRLKKENGAVDWSRPAVAIANQVRAFPPWPGTYTFWQRAGREPLRLILHRVRVEPAGEVHRHQPGEYRRLIREQRGTVTPGPRTEIPQGTIVEAGGGQLVVLTGDGALAIEQVQPAGKRVMTVSELLSGYGIRLGDRLGPA
jgi:methionyl-tRNA formyltransferase